jgi:chromosome segregation ATPase
MLNGVPQFLVLFATVAGAIILIGGALALARGSYTKASNQALREDNEDLRNRLSDCEDKIEDHERREQTLETQVEHLHSENKMLKTMITQRADVQTVLEELREHHTEAMTQFNKLIAAVVDLHELGGQEA